MRILKIFIIAFAILTVASCSSKTQPQPSLAGTWKITSAVGNDGRQWTGTFTLIEDDYGVNSYKGVFYWESVDGKSSGTDNVTGSYESVIKVLTLESQAITGNIEKVTYNMNIAGNGTRMTGTWTGSSDGTVENPGKLTASKQ
ncbi:hypothetical protein ACFQZI_17665 [Mucilaginibacter lutimaris]|uniref:Lipocalin-like domain-containing protein n=1 Tax=Mucilaginibacter lutimaris TaxID=931629 RepID=A0ABW2ZKB8_9SPHI